MSGAARRHHLEPFSQGVWLRQLRDEDSRLYAEVRGGVCAALCDHWLLLFRRPGMLESPTRRMATLGPMVATVVAQYQRRYRDLHRAQRPSSHDFDVARSRALQEIGLRAEDATTVGYRYSDLLVGADEITAITQTYEQFAFNDLAAVRRTMAGDLARPGAAASWSLVFARDRGAHALGGFRWFESAGGVHRPKFFLFDPNIGELSGGADDFDAMVGEVFGFYERRGIVITRVRRRAVAPE